MKNAYSQKHPYLTAVLLALLCTFMTGLGMAVSQFLELDSNTQLAVTTFFLLISIVIGLVIMKKSRFSLSEYGFSKGIKHSGRKMGWYIPLIVMELLPFAAGLNREISTSQYVLLLLFTVAVGFNEEIYFRGLALKFMNGKGQKKAILCSSLIFGILHLANAFNGKNTLYLILQMLFAFLVGFVLAEIVSITKSLWAVIIWHAAHDYIASITGDTLDHMALIILAIQVVILIAYAIYLWAAVCRDAQAEKTPFPLADEGRSK